MDAKREFTPAQQALIEKHRDWNVDNDWYDYTFDDFVTVAESFGFAVDKDKIRFSGFWSQGDGASFGTHWIDLQTIVQKSFELATITDYGDPTEWNGYVKEFADACSAVQSTFGAWLLNTDACKLIANTKFRMTVDYGHYSHDGYMQIEFEEASAQDGDLQEVYDDMPQAFKDAYNALCDSKTGLRDWLRDCARALYRALEEEHEYQTSDEAVWDSLEANGIEPEEDDEDDEPEDDTPILPARPEALLQILASGVR